MDFVLVREDYELANPHPEPYLTALARFGANKEEALVVEDSARGLSSAVAAGIECAVIFNEFACRTTASAGARPTADRWRAVEERRASSHTLRGRHISHSHSRYWFLARIA
jgi:beta-phosphoglucomutase-like phosphatase (HAD superfamily)